MRHVDASNSRWSFEVAVKAFNLLNETQRECADPQGREIRRGSVTELRDRY